MKLFTVGPVEMYPETLKIEGTQLPYFRDDAFSDKMKDIEKMFLNSLNAPDTACFAALTCSGTGGMDAAVQNVLNKKDKVLVINGGSFGQRFADICSRYEIPHEDYRISFGEAFLPEEFEKYAGKSFSALLVNACETGTGQRYDLDYLGSFCAENDILFIVDAVSAYLADEIDMQKHSIDVLITASHKALALSPGIALIALSQKARQRLSKGNPSYYFDLNEYIENQKRGQPPFTSAVGVILSLFQRLKDIISTGTDSIVILHNERALYFREIIKELPLDIPSFPLSNCCTPLLFPRGNAEQISKKLKDEYGFVLTPSGGALRDTMLRVGHLGNLAKEDFDVLTECLKKEI